MISAGKLLNCGTYLAQIIITYFIFRYLLKLSPIKSCCIICFCLFLFCGNYLLQLYYKNKKVDTEGFNSCGCDSDLNDLNDPKNEKKNGGDKQVARNNKKCKIVCEDDNSPQLFDPNDYQNPGSKSQKNFYNNQRDNFGTLDNELLYSDLDHVYNRDYNTLPVDINYKSQPDDEGYNFMPPEKWFYRPVRPPVCVSEKKCEPCPVYTHGAPVNVKEFNMSRRITQPDEINVNYINDKLNSGR